MNQLSRIFCFSNILKYSYKIYFGTETLSLALIVVEILLIERQRYKRLQRIAGGKFLWKTNLSAHKTKKPASLH